MYGHISYIIIYFYKYLCVFIKVYTYSCMTNFVPGIISGLARNRAYIYFFFILYLFIYI